MCHATRGESLRPDEQPIAIWPDAIDDHRRTVSFHIVRSQAQPVEIETGVAKRVPSGGAFDPEEPERNFGRYQAMRVDMVCEHRQASDRTRCAGSRLRTLHNLARVIQRDKRRSSR